MVFIHCFKMVSQILFRIGLVDFTENIDEKQEY